MNYKDTVLKQGQFSWKPSKWKESKDGKIDLRINIPLTNLFDVQAKQSFMRGVAEALSFMGNCQKDETMITSELLKSKFKEWGIPELGEIMDKQK
jgi:hypothetical protein